MQLTKPTEEGRCSLPNVTMTSDVVWDPSQFDEEWDEGFTDPPPPEPDEPLPEDEDPPSEDKDDECGERFTVHELNVHSRIQTAKNEACCTSNPKNQSS